MAGTVFTTLEAGRPVWGARVTMTDALGRSMVAETNCAGNFFLRPETWRPAYPVTTTVAFGTQTQTMESLIEREASCAACHGKQPSPTSAGAVFLWTGTAPDGVPGGCK